MYPENDGQFEEHIIEEVRRSGYFYEITFDKGTFFYVLSLLLFLKRV